MKSQNSKSTGVSTFASRTSPITDQSLQKSFHLSHPDKIELKKISSPSENKKYPTAQPDTTKIEKLNADNGLQGRTDRTQAGNMNCVKNQTNLDLLSLTTVTRGEHINLNRKSYLQFQFFNRLLLLLKTNRIPAQQQALAVSGNAFATLCLKPTLKKRQ